MTAEPFTSSTVPTRTLPETSGCPGRTWSREVLEETMNLPVEPEILAGTMVLKEFLRLLVTLLSTMACLRYSFSERSLAIWTFCSRACFSMPEMFFNQLYLFSVNKRSLETGEVIGDRTV